MGENALKRGSLILAITFSFLFFLSQKEKIFLSTEKEPNPFVGIILLVISLIFATIYFRYYLKK